jgi:hypothetical protein
MKMYEEYSPKGSQPRDYVEVRSQLDAQTALPPWNRDLSANRTDGFVGHTHLYALANRKVSDLAEKRTPVIRLY